MHRLKLSRGGGPSTAGGGGVAGAVVVAALLACTGPGRPSDVVVYASGTDLEGGNPLVTVHSLSRQMQRYALFVTLARYDTLLAPVPYGARGWQWSADRRELTFTLASGLRWHDGSPTTARDVAFTLLAAKDAATGYLRAADLAVVDTVVAIDDSTAVVRFTVPQPSFPLVLCELPIVPSSALASSPRAELKRAAFNLSPMGNGPFKFVDRRPGQRWRLVRNDDFPQSLGGPPKLAGLVIAVVDEPTTKFAGLASGDVDVAGIAPTMASLAARDPALRVVDYPILFTTGVVLNMHRAPFDDARVRRAISLSIDRQRIVDAALAGYGKPAAGPVPPESPYALPGAPAQDTVRADSLLDAAGWKRGAGGARIREGKRLDFELFTVGSGDNAIEQLLQSDLSARGIAMDIRQLELGAFLTAARAPEKAFDALITGVPGDVSLAFLASMFETAQRGGALDYAGYHSAGLDALFRRARSAPNDELRRAAWRELQDSLAAALPVAWIYHSRGVQGLSSRLINVRMDLRGELATLALWDVTAPPGKGRK